MTAILRRLSLLSQGIGHHPSFGEGMEGTKRAIDHLGYVQIDTLAVVERAHHHVLWSRVPGYEPNHLNQLVSQKQIFESWFHAASYLPMRDYRFVLPNMMLVRRGENRYYNNVDQGLMKNVLARVSAEGAIGMRGLDKKRKDGSSWWNSGPYKRAVERLYMQGDLMISSRKGMEKIYDLTERCLPSDIDLTMPTLGEYAEYLFDTTLRAHGVFTWKQLIHLKTGKAMRDAMQKVLSERLEDGLVKRVKIANMPNFYIDARAQEHLPAFKGKVKILSPFDNVLIHRERLSRLFNFNYRIECYVPAAKREFGYFCLPILYEDKFVGRTDCKAHRAEETLEVLSLHVEDDSIDLDKFFSAFKKELQLFADFNKCPKLDFSQSEFSPMFAS
jgi:uncharacterized protein YcaQ